MRGAPQRYPLLNSLESPADLRRLAVAKLPALARELRAFLIDTTPTHHGRFTAGLGSVELAIAAHYVFDTPHDRLVWDGGHQAYPHKILTGRRDRLRSTGQPGGLQPFPHRAESEYDAFGVGHSSTAISAALGMAIAAARRGEQRRVVAITGDGALTAGMAVEALNHAGSVKSDLLVILNDNDPSGSPCVGALSNYFARVLSGRVYTHLRESSKKALRRMPTVWELARRSERHLKGMVLPGTLFEELGFNYIGPLDGHDLSVLVETLRNLKKLRGPQFLHVVTRPGADFVPATGTGTKWPIAFAATAATPLSGVSSKLPPSRPTYGEVFGQWLCDMAAADPRIIGITPAMGETPGLREFAHRFPERCFDVSIAQQHAVTFAAGLAAEGLRPVVAIPATYLQRTYDQIIHDVALQRLPVLFAIEGAGLVGRDGVTHQGSYDLCYLRCIPHMTLMAPADENECRQMLYTATTLAGPAVVRYPCGTGPGVAIAAAMTALPVGRAQVSREGNSGLVLLVFGALLEAAAAIARRLDASLVNMRFVKPLDQDLLAALSARCRALVTIEENARAGGAGTAVAEALASQGLLLPLLQLGIPDRFIEHGTRESCLAAARLDVSGLSDSIERWWMLVRPEPLRSAARA
jgi:1-deoxy-D-xylulose-5-phosphate synthase